jgi:hypothetical protein
VEGSAPSKTEEKPTRSVSVRRAGNAGAPATVGGRERELENLRMIVIPLDLLAR